MKNLNTFWNTTLLIITSLTLSAQEPFNCDYNAYLFQANDIYAIDLASGNAYLVSENIISPNINGAAYNPADGYIWGSISSPNTSIVRIGKDFSTTIYPIAGLPSGGKYIGDINTGGIYFLKGSGNAVYKMDLNPSSSNYLTLLSTETLSSNPNIHDWAFNATDGFLYTVEKKKNILYRIDIETGNVTALGEVPILSGLNYTFGAVYFDADGNFYVSANQTGSIYIIQNVQDLDGTNAINSNIFAFGPSSSLNDGARCPTAPVPQEDCINGVDDDGDGLVDCDDPSCSGIASCPTIEIPTSASNESGLESNNRLSDLINKRNYNRVKSNYRFDASSAKHLRRTFKYAQKKDKSNLELVDFIPLGIISEDDVIESTPLDLINITNATDVYSVDYMREGIPVASILSLKTENGVYEHTKYICDRLLGAELISVSNIDINGQNFIKSIIKNTDNSTEFVLSFSAKVINNDTNFAIESHWNIDKYESGVEFYNFQIWSNSLDDLYLLGEEIINLLDTQKTVVDYNNSEPPTVFVRKGKYIGGRLDLQIVNTNETENVTFDAGLRETETSALNNITSTIDIGENYISELQLETGSLFDIGFRIGDGIRTPDDLFMSDGPWGIDDAAPGTITNSYIISPNEEPFDTNEFPIERNVALTAGTDDYIAAYRAITPRFKPVDLSYYNTIKLKARGTGKMEIRLIKESITDWEQQYKATVNLTKDIQDFDIHFFEFTSPTGTKLVLDDIKTIVFKMVSETGTFETKEMELKKIRFSKVNIPDFNVQAKDVPVVVPNPVVSDAQIYFVADEDETITLLVYNQLGRIVKRQDFDVYKGENRIEFSREGIGHGSFFCQIASKHMNYEAVQLIIK